MALSFSLHLPFSSVCFCLFMLSFFRPSPPLFSLASVISGIATPGVASVFGSAPFNLNFRRLPSVLFPSVFAPALFPFPHRSYQPRLPLAIVLVCSTAPGPSTPGAPVLWSDSLALCTCLMPPSLAVCVSYAVALYVCSFPFALAPLFSAWL